MDRKILGRRIREERLRLGMTQEQVAAYIDVSTTYIGFIERGERTVTLEKLSLLAQCFHVPIDSLLKEEIADSPMQYRENRLHDLWDASSADEKEVILSFTEFIVKRKEPYGDSGDPYHTDL